MSFLNFFFAFLIALLYDFADARASKSSFFEINEDPPVSKKELLRRGNDFVRVKTRIKYRKGKPKFVAPHLDLYYPVPRTHHTRVSNWVTPVTREHGYIMPHGIAAYADWIIMRSADYYEPAAIFGSTLRPQIVLTFTTCLARMLKLLTLIEGPIVLLSVANDDTVPINADMRLGQPTYMAKEFYSILSSNKVSHFYIENLNLSPAEMIDPSIVQKVSPLPIGAYLRGSTSDDRSGYPEHSTPILSRQRRMVVADYHRTEHEQWRDRLEARALCRARKDVCSALYDSDETGSLPKVEWVEAISKYPFILCTHGGGIDPSPKAWEAILVGTIPIVEKNSLYPAYGRLPIAFLDVKTTEFLRWANVSFYFDKWLAELGPYYEEGSTLRNQTLLRLETRYWHSFITEKIGRGYRHGYL